MKTLLAAMIVLVGLSAESRAAEAEASAYPQAQLLTEPEELQQALAGGKLVVLDARTRQAYEAGHVPSALWVDHDSWSQAFADGGAVADWSQRIESLGIGNETPVVVYDDQMSKNAARIWWILRYFGHNHTQLLNGGWVAWKSQDLPTSQQTPEAKQAKFQARVQDRRLTKTDDILAALGRGDFQVLDTRSFDEHCGLEKLKNARGGAIPGARHLEWSDLLDDETHRFKSPGELRKLLQESGLDLTKPISTHCQSGGRASVMAFGLELMGVKDVRNYYHGWSAWGNGNAKPIQTPAAEKPSGAAGPKQ